MIAQFYCLDCKKFFVESVERGCYAGCPHCKGENVRIISDYNWRLESDKDGLTKLPLVLQETEKTGTLDVKTINLLVDEHKDMYGALPVYIKCYRVTFDKYSDVVATYSMPSDYGKYGFSYRGQMIPVKVAD